MKVKIKRPLKAQPVQARDFCHPLDLRERRTGLVAAGSVLGVLVLLAAVTPGHLKLAAGVAVWAAAVFLAFGPVGDSVELKEYARPGKLGAEDRAWSATLMDHLGRIEARAPGRSAARLQVSPTASAVQTIGRTIVVPTRLREALSDREVSLLLAREVGHMRAGHSFLSGLVRRMAVAKPLLRFGAFPAYVLAVMLRRWMLFADFTADRFALTLFPDPKLLAQATLKQAISSESDSPLSIKDLEQHLAGADLSHPMEDELATHFKLGEYMKERPEIYARLREAANFVRSDKFKELVQRARESAQ